MNEPVTASVPSLLAKTWIDRLAASLGLLLLLPLLAVVALTIKLDSRGPIFFRQTRVGLGGRHFRMWKFRTMVRDAERRLDDVRHLCDTDGALFKIQHDPRVTRVGRFLRRHSLDELPQLINVVAGHMSLIGPRPALPVEVEAFDERRKARLRVKPGMTGLWQVSGRSDLSDDEAQRLDEMYVEQWSLRMDASILLRTVRVVATGDGAY